MSHYKTSFCDLQFPRLLTFISQNIPVDILPPDSCMYSIVDRLFHTHYVSLFFLFLCLSAGILFNYFKNILKAREAVYSPLPCNELTQFLVKSLEKINWSNQVHYSLILYG